MAKKYGLPYQGSKNKLAERIVALLPPATHLYDVFAGGCAVSHAALLSGKFKKVHANDITDSVTLFEDALNGKYANESRWISREDFFRLKDSDPYVRIVWSFGNNQHGYLYSKDIEPYKKAVHEMVYAPTPTERRLKFRGLIREMERRSASLTNKKISLRFMKDNQAAEATQRIASIGMQKYMSVNDLHITICDYRDLDILPESVIYCDPPYKDTGGYGMAFDHEAFYNWCEQQTSLVCVSEYSMPSDRFICIAEFEHKSTFSATGNSLNRIEKVFVPKSQLGMYQRMINQ